MGGTPLRSPRECLPTAGRKGLLRPAHPPGHVGTGRWGALRLGRGDTPGGETRRSGRAAVLHTERPHDCPDF